ncbi:hypothetical protein, partial [Seonamhaeicola sp.]|uniref:hypothetical protein n=1 Tax=Seonamhaeicola sp. TaxID=1912245 RepID=UPI003562066E
GLYALFCDRNEAYAEDFMNQLCTGQYLTNVTISLLRQKLMQDKMTQKRLPLNIRYSLILKTWNFYRKKKEVKLLKFDLSVEDFPPPLNST